MTLRLGIRNLTSTAPQGRVQKHLIVNGNGNALSAICIYLERLQSLGAKPIARVRSYDFADGLVVGDALFQFEVHRRATLWPLFFMIRFLAANLNRIPFHKCTWPAGLLKIEPEMERAIADAFMRPLGWIDIQDHPEMRQLAVASSTGSSLSPTGLYIADGEKVRSRRALRVIEKFLEGSYFEIPCKISESLYQIVFHSYESGLPDPSDDGVLEARARTLVS